MSKEGTITIQTAQLQLGMYVYIDLGWMDHPFPLNRFKIKTEGQIATIRALGIQEIRYSPENSDVPPLSPEPVMIFAPPPTKTTPELAAMLLEKQEQRVRLEQHRSRVRECEKIISSAAKLVRTMNSEIFSRPRECMASAHQLMDSFLDILLSDNGTVLFALNDKLAGEEIYVHSVNVSVLATLIAKEMKVPPADIKLIGLGCLFHDIGKLEIPTKVTLKIDPLTSAEKSLLHEHVNYGERIARNAMLDPAALAVVVQHHEYIDGSGYPNRLRQDKISPLAQLVAIINLYDNLCNPVNPALALTPHEALSTLYTQYRTKLNARILQVFIRFMGVYPPGSIVSLSDGTIGIVVSVASGKSLRPTLLVYDPDVPKEEAILLDMETLPDVNISKAIRPALLSPEVFAYLSPRKRATYFFDATKS